METIPKKQLIDDAGIGVLRLSVRCYNGLVRRGDANTLGDLFGLSVDDLYKSQNLGSRSIDEIIAKAQFYFRENKIDRLPSKEKDEEGLFGDEARFYNIPISSLNLSQELNLRMKKYGIDTVGQLMVLSEYEIGKLIPTRYHYIELVSKTRAAIAKCLHDRSLVRGPFYEAVFSGMSQADLEIRDGDGTIDWVKDNDGGETEADDGDRPEIEDESKS